MKVELSRDGVLALTPETEAEAQDLNRWFAAYMGHGTETEGYWGSLRIKKFELCPL